MRSGSRRFRIPAEPECKLETYLQGTTFRTLFTIGFSFALRLRLWGATCPSVILDTGDSKRSTLPIQLFQLLTSDEASICGMIKQLEILEQALCVGKGEERGEGIRIPGGFPDVRFLSCDASRGYR